MSLLLTILPIGAVQADDLDALTEMLSTAGFKVSIGAALDLPSAAYDPDRDQYGAESLLGVVRRRVHGFTLGVADVDLYAAGLNFALGLAEAPGDAAVVALPRLRIGADEDRFHDRMAKEGMHELGHCFGLGHCWDPGCVMHFSNSLADTDRKSRDFCSRCKPHLPGGLGREASD